MPARAKKTSFALQQDQHVSNYDLASALDSYMLEYTVSTLQDRAIPNIDGLKPVHRRILYTMYKLHLLNGKATKLNNVGGTTMLLHPHGDSSASTYTLAAPWLNNVPMVKVIGNGGNIFGGVDDASATRYTSGTLLPSAQHMLESLDEHATIMKPSYDGERMEPTLLPVEYPNAFMNRSQGIGTALATNIYPHNPKELINALLYYIDHPGMTIRKAMEYIKGPDFPTGGLLVNPESANKQELMTGQSLGKQKARYTVRAEAEIHDGIAKPYIKFISIPYDTTLEKMMASVKDFVDDHSELGIIRVLEESSDYDQIDIELYFKRGISRQKLEQILALLYAKTQLEVNITPNNLMIINGRPKHVGIIDYFKAWLEFRQQCLKRQLTYERQKDQERQEIVRGLLRLVDISDQVVEDAKQSENKSNFKDILQKKYQFTERQSEAIASMALYRLGRQDTKKLKTEDAKLTDDIVRINKILESDHSVNLEIKRQLRHLNRTLFKDCERRTKIVHATKIDHVKIKKTTLIPKQTVRIVAKRNGCVQRMSKQVFGNHLPAYLADQGAENLVMSVDGNTQQGAMFFTKQGQSVVRIVNDLENLNLEKDPEPIAKQIPDYQFDDEMIGGVVFDLPIKDQVLLAVTKLGRVKLVNLDKVMPSLSTKRYAKHLSKYFGLRDDNDTVVFVKSITKNQLKQGLKLEVHRSEGRTKEKVVDLSKLSIQGGSGAGTRIWKMKPDDSLKNFKLIELKNNNGDKES